MKKLLPIGAMLLLPLLGCQKPADEEKKSEEAPRAEAGITLGAEARKTAEIRTQPARVRAVASVQSVPGIVEAAANRTAKVTPPAPGKIVRLTVRPGDTVRAGQVLALLESFEVAQGHSIEEQAGAAIAQARATLQTARAEAVQVRAGVNVADAEIASAKVRAGSAKQALERQKQLAAAGAFAQGPLQTAQAELTSSQSELLKARTELQAHQIVLQRTERLFKAEVVSRAELEQAQLEQRQDEQSVEKASQHVELARLTLEREEKVAGAGLLDARELQTAEAEVRSAESEVRKAESGRQRAVEEARKAEKSVRAARVALAGSEASLRAARASLSALAGGGRTAGRGGQLAITAPIAGAIVERRATLGEAVERDTVLMTIQNADAVQITARVPEADVARIRPGQQATVTVAAYPKEGFTAVVRSVAAQVDEKTRALPVRLLAGNPRGKLKPQMFARVALRTGMTRKALVVPESAIVEEGDKAFAFVEQGGKFEKRAVTLGIRTAGLAEVLTGIKAGEPVVVEGGFVLKSESKKVELKGEE